MFCGCVGCGEDGASSNLPLVIVMHMPAVLSLLCVANKTLSTWRLRLSGDIEENPGPDLDPKQAKNDRGREKRKPDSTDIGGGMAAKHQHDTRGVSPPQQHAVGQGRVDQHENSPSRENAGRHGNSPSGINAGRHGNSLSRVNAGRHGNSPSRVNAGRHGNSPSRVNAGRHEVKASRPSDKRTVPVVAVVSSVRHVRERTNHSTVAVTGDGRATPVTQASL
ncbi:hypothetical protein ACOMHN_057453 [Nucella lapillus]